MLKNIKGIVIVFLCCFLLNSCLTAEKKTYIFQMKNKKSGTLIINYYNIFSQSEKGIDVSSKDFQELIDVYLKGENIEKEYPNTKLIKKRLFERKGKLCAEIVLEFDNLEDVKLYRHNGKGNYMLSLSNNISESFAQSNGKYGGEIMPVLFWNKKKKELKLSSKLVNPTSDCIELLGFYKEWKKKN